MTAADQIRAFAAERCSADEIATFVRVRKTYVRWVIRHARARPSVQPVTAGHRRDGVAHAFANWLRSS